MKNIRLGCRIISLLILFTLIAGWKNSFLLFPQHISFWSLVLVSLGLTFFILNLAAALGLYFIKSWGFITAYIAILFSTLFFSSCYLPYITKLFPMQVREILFLVINFAIFYYVAVLHIQFLRLTKNKASD